MSDSDTPHHPGWHADQAMPKPICRPTLGDAVTLLNAIGVEAEDEEGWTFDELDGAAHALSDEGRAALMQLLAVLIYRAD